MKITDTGSTGKIDGLSDALHDSFYQHFLKPILFRLDAETAHELTLNLAPYFAPCFASKDALEFENSHLLSTSIAATRIKCPVGLAAGFDKNGRLTKITHSLGFGFHEVGSITAKPSKGNPKPRLFRLADDRAVINRLGLNGEGARAVAQRLGAGPFVSPVGVNIAKTNHPSIRGDAAVEDILFSFDCIKELPLSYVAINASCPNTHEGIMEERREIDEMLAEVMKRNRAGLSIFLKVSPDSSDDLLCDLVELAGKHSLTGFICGNTTTSRDGLRTPLSVIKEIGNGGLSGVPLKTKALDLVGRVYRMKRKEQTIVGCGGVFSGDDAYEFLKAGASCVELYTALVYEGPKLPYLVNRRLAHLLARDGLTAETAVGAS